MIRTLWRLDPAQLNRFQKGQLGIDMKLSNNDDGYVLARARVVMNENCPPA